MPRVSVSLLVAAVLFAGVMALAMRRAEYPAPPLVLAASSVQEALNAAADGWAAQGHARPVLSFAASSALARQVAAGAPADLFLSADEAWMDDLAARGLLRAGTRADFVSNRLVLIAPVASPLRLEVAAGMPLRQALGKAGRLAMADPAGVPAGVYGRQALSHFGLWDGVADRLARGENVRAALALVARGEAPLGIVYATDALAEKRVRVIAEFPPSSHAPITYPLAALARSANPEAEGFRRYLLSGEGQALFRRFGFGTP